MVLTGTGTTPALIAPQNSGYQSTQSRTIISCRSPGATPMALSAPAQRAVRSASSA